MNASVSVLEPSLLLQIFADKLVEIMSMDDDYIWIHDYHLLVLPSLLRKKFNKMRCGLFLHSPFPSSEIFRTFPKRDELIRSMLNADLIGMPPPKQRKCGKSCKPQMSGSPPSCPVCYSSLAEAPALGFRLCSFG